MPDKPALHAGLIAELTTALAAAEAAHAAALEGATHAEARAENPKDTRGLEQSYLARGQAQRVAELAAGLAEVTALALRPFGASSSIALSALVTIEEDGFEQQLFLAPHGGGHEIDGVMIVTPASPLGRSLLGKRVDDEVEVRVGPRTRSLVVVAIE